MKIMSWNVNSVNSRLERLLRLLQREQPDAILLQELKCVKENFPEEAIQALGYRSEIFGQKQYNGVAIITKEEVRDADAGLKYELFQDSDSRVLCATLKGVRLVSVYAPNGKEIGCEAYEKKLVWYQNFSSFLEIQKKTHAGPIVIGGDFNIVPHDIDTHDPIGWKDHIFHSERERTALQKILDLGYVDTFRSFAPDLQAFSWWDYRQLSFLKNKGLRIDLLLTQQAYAPNIQRVWIDREERKGEKPSDHAPVGVEIRD